MAADSRTYIRLHDGMPDHPKVDGLSDRAFRLLVESWCWCSRHLTDGRIPATTWKKRGTPAARRELEAAGLIEQVVDGAYVMHDYLEHQRSADEVAAMREQRREAGRAGGKARAKNQAKSKRAASDLLSESLSKTQASTETETETESTSGGDGEPSAQPLIAEWLDRCSSRPPGRVIGQVAKELRVMLDEGIPTADVRSGLAAWHHKGLHPATLPSVVHETRTASDRPPAEDPNAWMRRSL